MPSGLIALLDDVATIAKLAASSLDDVAGAAGKAGSKAVGVVIDDTAVTPRYVVGLSPERELPIIGKIAVGSLKNKLLILLPAALLLTAFAPFLIIPLLMIGGAYLAFEATEKIAEAILHDHHHPLRRHAPHERCDGIVGGIDARSDIARPRRRICREVEAEVPGVEGAPAEVRKRRLLGHSAGCAQRGRADDRAQQNETRNGTMHGAKMNGRE